MSKEVRYSELDGVECRAENGVMTISGYAVRYDQPSKPIFGEFIEFIDKRAFDNVDLNNTFLLYNHNSDHVLGNTRSGTMTIDNTDAGLHFSANLPNTERAKETYELIKRGDVSGMSFGFTVKSDTWNNNVTPSERTVREIGELFEVSVVPFPAYESTQVSARAMDFMKECKECKASMNNPLAKEAKDILEGVKL